MLNIRLRHAVLALALLAGHTAAAPIPDYPFVHVTGSAFQTVMPDIGSLDFEIVATDADPAAARATVEARLGELRDLTQKLDVPPDDVAVREVRQSLRKDEHGANGAPLVEVRCDVHINVRNLSNWAALAGGLLGKPNLDGFAASFDRSDMDKINDDLMTQAIANARRQADVMAAGFGRKVGAVMGATPDALKNLTTAMGLERSEFRRPGGDDRARGQDVDREQLLAIHAIKLRQPVDVIFRLDNAPKRGR